LFDSQSTPFIMATVRSPEVFRDGRRPIQIVEKVSDADFPSPVLAGVRLMLGRSACGSR
jgi:hypothetical protein